MDKLFENDLYLKILSVALAVVLWFQVMGELNPTLPNIVRDVALELTNIPTGMVVVEQQPATITVKYTGSGRVAKNNIHATVDLKGAQVGQTKYTIQVVLPQSFQLVEVSPTQVTIRLDTTNGKQVPVTVNVTGAVGEDFATRPAIVQPTQTLVNGPSASVAKVTKVIGEVDVTGATSDVNRSVPLRAVDAAGNEIKDVAIEPSVVSVTVPLVKLPPGKLVDVEGRVVGTPADGREVAKVTVEPSSVKVRGDAAAIAGITSVAALAVDVSGATVTVVKDVSIALPAGVQLTEPATVRVTVEIVPTQSTRVFGSAQVLVTDLRTGLSATAAPNMVSVTVRGPADIIGALAASEVKAVISAHDLGPGTYRLKPQIVVPAGYTVVDTAPIEVAVTITGP